MIPAGSSATTAYLYPFSTEYTAIWYGDCTDEISANFATLQPSEGGTALVSVPGLDDLAYEVVKTPPVSGTALRGRNGGCNDG